MLQTAPRRPGISVGRLKKLLAGVPDDHSLVPSQVYDLFVVDKDGHNKGYISASGELHWWPAEPGRRSTVPRHAAMRRRVGRDMFPSPPGQGAMTGQVTSQAGIPGGLRHAGVAADRAGHPGRGEVDSDHLEALRRGLYAGGKVGRPEADFLVELHKRVQHPNPAFEQLFYQAIKDHILADGRIDAEEAAWLRRMLFADGKITDEERKFLHELKGEARADQPGVRGAVRGGDEVATGTAHLWVDGGKVEWFAGRCGPLARTPGIGGTSMAPRGSAGVPATGEGRPDRPEEGCEEQHPRHPHYGPFRTPDTRESDEQGDPQEDGREELPR